MITIGDKKYKVVENLGYVHSIGKYAKVINYEGKERVVLKFGKTWVPAKPVLLRPGSGYTGQ